MYTFVLNTEGTITVNALTHTNVKFQTCTRLSLQNYIRHVQSCTREILTSVLEVWIFIEIEHGVLTLVGFSNNCNIVKKD